MATLRSRSFVLTLVGFCCLFGSVTACGGSSTSDPAAAGGNAGAAGTAGTGAGGGQNGCKYDGQTYFPGESFPAGDGCNTCTCAPSGEVACTKMGCVGCEYNGQTYKPGDSFPAGDGCNDCTCMENGQVSCTLAYCAPVCVYAGVEYPAGATFPALDGCNKCTCNSDGTVGCTEIACPCDPANEWWRNYVATNPKTCEVIDYACTGNTTPFTNACGCGCEQDASCPQVIDCKPPKPCDPALIEKCPYSYVAK